MQTRTFLSLGAIAVALGLSACSSMMDPNTTTLHATLSGTQEVPANGTAGSGTLEARLDTQTNTLVWTLTYAGLTGPVKAGHFHGPAATGNNAPVALAFTGNLESPIKGTATLTPTQAADLLAGKWYVNLHTAANPGGEVRGQVMPTR